MNDISLNIKKVMVVFLLCFMILISYMAYFEIVRAPKLVANTANKRLWVKRNSVLRGTIYDRNNKALTKSERVDELTQKREYTGGAMFAHILGYVDIKYGITGLEYKYDAELMGTNSDESLTQLLNKNNDDKKIGDNLITTLDFDLQKLAYDALGDNKGAVVALNPETGEVLAMVSKPSFDPNNLSSTWAAINTDKGMPLINRATSGLYPPGSTFKTITALSSLQNIDGIMNERFQDEGKLVFNSKESLSNYDGEVLGNLSFKDAYVQSSNVVFGTLALKLGNDKLKSTAESFYFNKQIPSDGIYIEPSRFPTLKSYEKGNIARSGIGQASVLASPMQMALIASTIANDGTMMKPYLVQEVLSVKGEVKKEQEKSPVGDIISKEDAKTMKDFMRGVVTDGTGTRASIKGIDVCGKTGTAEHVENGKPAPAHSWFIGFAPYNNPKIAVAVIVENGGLGGVVAANIAGQVMKQWLIK